MTPSAAPSLRTARRRCRGVNGSAGGAPARRATRRMRLLRPFRAGTRPVFFSTRYAARRGRAIGYSQWSASAVKMLLGATSAKTNSSGARTSVVRTSRPKSLAAQPAAATSVGRRP